MFYVQNIRFVIFLIDLWKIGYGQILSFSDHGPSCGQYIMCSVRLFETSKSWKPKTSFRGLCRNLLIRVGNHLKCCEFRTCSWYILRNILGQSHARFVGLIKSFTTSPSLSKSVQWFKSYRLLKFNTCSGHRICHYVGGFGDRGSLFHGILVGDHLSLGHSCRHSHFFSIFTNQSPQGHN